MPVTQQERESQVASDGKPLFLTANVLQAMKATSDQWVTVSTGIHTQPGLFP